MLVFAGLLGKGKKNTVQMTNQNIPETFYALQ